MHFAGSIVVPESVEQPLEYYENNTVKSRALIESAVKGGVAHFIFSSTAATYGIPERGAGRRGRADPADQPLWLVEADDRADAERQPPRPIRSTIARCAISTSPAPIRRAAPANRRRGATHLIKVAVEAATGKRGHVDVYGTDYDTPDGTGVRDYIHVSDLAARPCPTRSSG